MPDNPHTGAWRSPNWCLTVPKIVPDDCQVPFLGSYLRSQIWCLTTGCTEEYRSAGGHLGIGSEKFSTVSTCNTLLNCSDKISKWPPVHLYYSVQPVVRHHIWDIQNYTRNGAGRSTGTSFGTVRHHFWDCQAPVLGLSGVSFGISRLCLGYKKEPKRYNKGCFRVFRGVL